MSIQWPYFVWQPMAKMNRREFVIYCLIGSGKIYSTIRSQKWWAKGRGRLAGWRTFKNILSNFDLLFAAAPFIFWVISELHFRSFRKCLRASWECLHEASKWLMSVWEKKSLAVHLSCYFYQITQNVHLEAFSFFEKRIFSFDLKENTFSKPCKAILCLPQTDHWTNWNPRPLINKRQLHQ